MKFQTDLQKTKYECYLLCDTFNTVLIINASAQSQCSLHGISAGQSGNGTAVPLCQMPLHQCPITSVTIFIWVGTGCPHEVAVSRDSISSHSYHNSHKYYTFGRFVQPVQTVFMQRLIMTNFQFRLNMNSLKVSVLCTYLLCRTKDQKWSRCKGHCSAYPNELHSTLLYPTPPYLFQNQLHPCT